MAGPSVLDILLVEDSPSDRRLIEECFQAAETQSRVHSVADGECALEFLQREGEFTSAPRPDLIILDLGLPGMGGMEVLKAAKTDNGLKSIPVIVLTASAIEEDVHRAYELQASCYFSKPTDLEGFMDLVESIEQHWLRRVRLPSGSTDAMVAGDGRSQGSR